MAGLDAYLSHLFAGKDSSLILLIFIAYHFMHLVVWGLAMALSKGDGLRLFASIERAWQNLRTTIVRYPVVFGLTLIYMIGESLYISHPPTPVTASQTMLVVTQSMTMGIGAFIAMTICQMVTYRANIEVPASAAPGKNNNKFLACLKLMVVVTITNLAVSALLMMMLLPGILFGILSFIAGPVCISEGKLWGTFKRSIQLTRPHFGAVVKFAIPLGLLHMVSSWSTTLAPAFLPQPDLRALVSIGFKTLSFFVTALLWQCQCQMYNYLTATPAEDS